MDEENEALTPREDTEDGDATEEVQRGVPEVTSISALDQSVSDPDATQITLLTESNLDPLGEEDESEESEGEDADADFIPVVDEIIVDDEPEVGDSDRRVSFIHMYLNGTFRVKKERWLKMLASESHRKLIFNFLDTPNVQRLYFTNPAYGYVRPVPEFPANKKTKFVYFIKKSPETITEQNMYDLIMFADVAPNPIDDLGVLLDKIFVPISCGKQKEEWPASAMDTIKRKTLEMRDRVYRLREEMKKQKMLVMPEEINGVFDVEAGLNEKPPKPINVKLRIIYEQAVLAWSTYLDEGILSLKSTDMQGGDKTKYPLPSSEYQFWEERVKNLENLYQQLKDPKVRCLARILEATQSMFLPCFKEMLGNVMEALNEARDMEKYLYPLKLRTEALQSTPFESNRDQYYPLLYTLGMIWANCPGFNSDNVKFFHITKLICNMMVLEGYRAMDPPSIFHGDVDDNLPKINKVIANMKLFRTMLEEFDPELREIFPDKNKSVIWLYYPHEMFDRYDKNLLRLQELQHVLHEWSEYNKLEKITVGGFYAEHLSQRLDQLALDFEDLLNHFRNVSYDPGDIDDKSWDEDYDMFKHKLNELDNKLAAVASLTFDDCTNFESIFKMMYLFQPFLEKGFVKKSLEPKYDKIAESFKGEVINVYKIYNDQMTKVKETGLFDCPIMWPPVAGSLLWLRDIRRRIAYPLENVSNFKHECCDTDDVNLSKEKAHDLITKAAGDELEIFDKWSSRVASEIKWNMRKTVLNASNAKILTINFDKKLTAALREVRYLKCLEYENFPPEAAELFARSEELHEWNMALHKAVGWYNFLRQKTKSQEFDIVQDEVTLIDEIAADLILKNNWNSENNWEIIVNLRDEVSVVYERMTKAQENLEKIIRLINQWNDKPLFDRPKGKREELLVHSDVQSVNQRYDEIIKVGEVIYELIERNFRLLHALPVIVQEEQGLAESRDDEGEIGTVAFVGDEEEEVERGTGKSREPPTEAQPETADTAETQEDAEVTEQDTEGEEPAKQKSKKSEDRPSKTSARMSSVRPVQDKRKRESEAEDDEGEDENEEEGEETVDVSQQPEMFPDLMELDEVEDEDEEEEEEEEDEEEDEDEEFIRAQSTDILLIERPYQRAYYLAETWKNERLAGRRPKYLEYTQLPAAAVVDDVSKIVRKKDMSPGKEKARKEKEKADKKKEKPVKKEKTGVKKKGDSKAKEKEVGKRKEKEEKEKVTKEGDASAEGGKEEDKKKIKKQAGPKETSKVAEEIPTDKKETKETKGAKGDKEDKGQKRISVISDIGDIGGEQAQASEGMGIDDDLPKEDEKPEEELKKPEASPSELYSKLMEEFAKNPDKIDRWDKYLDLVDDYVGDGLLKTVDNSIELFVRQMAPEPKVSPLFELKMKLKEPDIEFEPSLDEDENNRKSLIGLYSVIEKDLNAQALLVPRISYARRERTYMDDVLKDPNIEKKESDTKQKFLEAIAKTKEWAQKFYVYEFLWKESRSEHLRQFLKYNRLLTPEEIATERKMIEDPTIQGPALEKPQLQNFKQKIDFYEGVYTELDKMQMTDVIDNWLRIDLSLFKVALLTHCKKWSQLYKTYLINEVNVKLRSMDKFIVETMGSFEKPIIHGDYDGLVAIIGARMKVQERAAEADTMFEQLSGVIRLLKEYGISFPMEIHFLLKVLPNKWKNVKNVAVSVRENVAPLLAEEAGLIKKRLEFFDIRSKLFMRAFKKNRFYNWDCWEPYMEIDNCEKEVAEFEDKCAKLVDQAYLFEVPVPEFTILKAFRKELKMVKMMWDYINVVLTIVEDWERTPWKKIDSEVMDIELKKFTKELRALDRDMRDWELYKKIENTIKNMMTALRAIAELQNPAMRDRHWQQLMEATKVKFVILDTTTLKELLDLNLYKYEEEVKNIVDKSVKENIFEKILGELKVTWSQMEFSYETHPRTGCKVLKVSDESVEVLEENQVQLQNMMNSKFVSYFLEEVTDWQKKLSIADIVISSWVDVQRTWLYLESIFIGSEDIRRQLPEESRLFDRIDREIRSILQEMAVVPNIVKATNRPFLQERIEGLRTDLTKCEKALSEYLETKRLAYPRFYFVSSADLLDILSNGNQPELVCRHLTKLYDSLAKLKFKQEGGKNTKLGIGFWAKDGEYVATTGVCNCSGQVEKWLNNVTEIMRRTLRNIFNHAYKTYNDKPREVWIFDYPAQVALVGTQIYWSVEVEVAFSRIEEGYDTAMKEYQKKQIAQLNALINLMLGDLSDADRQKVTTVCTIDVHSRDVVAKMITMKIEDVHAFQWQSQLRHRWDTKLYDVYVNICDAQFKYDYEYLGNTPRLVITPLTDRCYITLTQSLHLIMGGAPAGPAGTGKTETTKDLGKGLGMMVYVFNCSEQMDYKSCGNIYKGLAQTGAWGCFDEFNRISVEVLSVVALQVKTVLDAIKAKKTMFNFQGEIIALVNTVGMFITMNPGYAGRAELPENLKALFRPCAMVVPDFELICENMLIGEAFQDARVLGKKFLTLYSLCKELLSKQDHYDWGLRAIKSVLVVAGKLRRGDKNRPEDQVLMRALRDFNVPKIVTADVPVFMGLIGDLFPGLDVPRKRDLDFEKLVKIAAIDMGLQPEDNFILKVVQLVELFAVRHSVFIIGFAGTGKSCVWKCLYRTYLNMKKRPHFNDLEPKAVTNDELFGIINPQTREWKDGLFSVLIREQANMTGDGPKWMVLDGDIDPMWIESLNTVMDDNKVLTLASNERIALTAHMRLLFEISNLRTATPATVSRAGILYINPTDLGWRPYVTSWLDSRSNETERTTLNELFQKYVPPVLEASHVKWKRITPIPEIAHIHMLCSLLEVLLVSANTPADCPIEWYEIYFVFASIWAFGSATFKAQLVDWRMEFTSWWVREFQTVPFPAAVMNGEGTVFDYYVGQEDKSWMPWTDKLTEFELDVEVPLQSTLVNTAETTRVRFFLDMLIDQKKPVMLIAPAGSGKSVLLYDKLSSLSEKYGVTNIPFNFYTTSEALQRVLEKPLEKKAGRNFGPPGNKTMIYFIDDMNMPEVDKYGTVQPHTLVRQYMDYQHWYDRQKLSLKDINNILFLACMNPAAGSFTIDSRLQRHFYVFALSFPNLEALSHIYTSMLSQHMNNPSNKFAPEVAKTTDLIIDLALVMHSRMQVTFLPTAIKFHYIFSLRDLSNIFQSVILTNQDCVTSPVAFIRLWMHEANRIYSDRLVSLKEQAQCQAMIMDTVRKGVTEYTEEEIIVKPLIFCHFAEGIGDSRYMPISSWPLLYKLLTEAMGQYNELVSTMQLVLFEDAMAHICRINRVMEMPRGNAMLVGVGGSGKQSLSRLSAFICGLDPFQIQLRKGYSVTDMKTDLSVIYNKAGMKNMGIMFLMTDAQVPEERFLTPINDMLASGDVPELFPDDEVESIINAVGPEVKSAGLPDTREAAWKFFIDRVRKNLKTMLCFSPVGSTLRVRARKFPALVNCTTVDWFMEWPKSALESVSYRFLGDIRQVPANLKTPISLCMARFHMSVNQMSQTYLLNEKRYCYTTPKSFLELISLYGKMLQSKFKENKDKIYKLQNGLQKLVSCAEEATVLKSKLGEQQKIVAEKNRVAGELVKLVGTEAEKVSKEKMIAQEEERKSQIMEVEVSIKQKVCEEDLVKAMPALEAAQAALNTLNKDNLTELKTFVSPAVAVARVAEAVLVLLSATKKGGKVPKDRSWKACKAVMGSADGFLQQLISYPKENIPDTVVRAVQEYITHPEFTPENVITKSSAAAGLCAWVINIMRFHEVWMVVLPKKKAEAAARTELMRTKEKLAELMNKITKLESELAILTGKFEQAVDEKNQCQRDEERMIEAIDLANRLINGLSSENARWKETVITLTKQLETFPGDLLLVSSFVSYQGGFSRKYRMDLMDKHWRPSIDSFDNPKIPMSGNVDPLEMLADESQIAMWQNEGLPNDRMSSENAAILTNCARWPLMIDPQLQGIKWVKNKYGSGLKVLRLGSKNYLDQIENAVAVGSTILFENIGETVDPVLDNLLGRNLVKKGKVLVIGDREIDFHRDFRLILHTKLGNPHYQPEIQAQTTLINFTVTRDGLEEQFLAEVVKAERPDLERLMSNLTKQMNSYKITLKMLEDELLVRLSNAGPDILQDRVLVEKLETTKKTAEHISIKMTEAKSTSAKINIAREVYRPVAERSSLLYFIMNDLQKINPIYQFSLKAFNIVFHHAVLSAEPANTVTERVENLTESISFEYFMYTCRALFEVDKINFMSIMALQIQAKIGDVTQKELDFLLRFPYVPNLTSPVEFLTSVQWGGIKALCQMDEFKNLDKDIEGAFKRWKAFVDGDNPERERFPLDWKNKSAFQKLCMMRALRPDRMVYAMRYYIEQKLGSNYTGARSVEFDKSFEETSSTVPVFFILSAGVDPTRDVERVGKRFGFGVEKKNFHNVSLGQGQEMVAERAIETSSKLGHWVILQNIHLVARWLPSLDKKMEAAAMKPHHNYRLFISAEPAPDPAYHVIPQGVLENAIKITNEAPTGMQANLHKALDNFNQDTLEMCSKEAEFKAILFSLCYFHAVVAERRKFGPQGWNRTYPFNVGDLTISVHVLYNYLENNQSVPWEDLRYLFGEIMYGGHITDDWDRRLCRTYLREYMCPELVEGDLFYCPGFQAPPNSDYLGYHKYIDAMIPPESPILYGLHPNAEYNFLITQAEKLFKTIFELQPRDTGAAEGDGISREDKVTAIIANVTSKMTDGFDIDDMMNRTEDRSPFTIVAFQECERMNILMSEMRRTLRELSLGLKGELTITNEMEQLEEFLFMDQVPASWMARAYPSQLPLSAWTADLNLRLQVLQNWISDFTLPATIWLGGLFNPQSFLTAIMQTTARKNEWPLDKMCLQCDVSKKGVEEFTMAPREGAYLGLLYMEGARWDVNTGSIVESKPKELYPLMPVIHCKAITLDKQDTRNIYECPVYKTKMRGPTFVWTFNLKTRVKSSKWVLAGVGILLSN